MKVALAELVDFKGGGTPSKKNEAYWGGSIPWASVKDFKTTELSTTTDFITEEGLKNSASNLIPAGNIIVPTRMALGKVAFNTVDLAINQDLRALLVKDESRLDKRYLMRFIESKSSYLENEGKGATVKGITLDVLKSLEVSLPSLKEQQRIAAILDKSDAIRRKRQQAIALADEFLRAVFLDMFGDPVTNPKGWEVKVCSEISRQITVGLVIKPASYYVEYGVPAIRSLNIKKSGIDKDNFVFFSKEDNEGHLSKSRVFSGDLVIVRSGQPGKAAVVPEDLDGVNAIDVLILRPDKTLINT